MAVLEYRHEENIGPSFSVDKNQLERKHAGPAAGWSGHGAAPSRLGLWVFDLVSEPGALIYQASPYLSVHSFFYHAAIFCSLSLNLGDASLCWFGRSLLQPHTAFCRVPV